MRKMCLALASLFILSQVPSLVQAEPMWGKDPQKMEQKKGKMMDKHLTMLTKKLSLSSDQQTAVKAALETKSSKMGDLRKEFSEKAKAIKDESDTQITAVLNDDQKATYKALQDEMHKKRKEHREERREKESKTDTGK